MSIYLFIKIMQICSFNSFNILNTSSSNKTKVPAIVIYLKNPYVNCKTTNVCMLSSLSDTTLFFLQYCANLCLEKSFIGFV